MITEAIKIYKDAVYTEVDKHTSYAGAKSDATLYDKVRVKSGDKTMLERWWADACGLVTTMLVPYVTAIATEVKDTTGTDTEAVTTTSEGFTITLGLPSNWNTALEVKIHDAIQEVITDYLLQQWYQLLNIEGEATAAANKQSAAAIEVATLLYARVRPTRPTYEEDIYG